MTSAISPATSAVAGDPAHLGAPSRADLADRLLSLFPALRHSFQAALPSELRHELASATPHQMEALCHLVREGGVTMHELARAQSCAMSTATALADRLLRQGLARRVHDDEDRRVVRLIPTKGAAALIERFGAAKRQAGLQAIAALDDRELATLVRLLDKIAQQPTEPGHE